MLPILPVITIMYTAYSEVVNAICLSLNNASTLEVVARVKLDLKDGLELSPFVITGTELLDSLKFPAQPGARYSEYSNGVHSYHLYLYPLIRLDFLYTSIHDMWSIFTTHPNWWFTSWPKETHVISQYRFITYIKPDPWVLRLPGELKLLGENITFLNSSIYTTGIDPSLIDVKTKYTGNYTVSNSNEIAMCHEVTISTPIRVRARLWN